MKYLVEVERVQVFQVEVTAKNVGSAEEKVISMVVEDEVNLSQPADEDWNIRDIEVVKKC